MKTEKYKIKGGVREFDSYVEAVKVAEIKAREEDSPITVCKRTLKDMKNVLKVYPDSSTENLED